MSKRKVQFAEKDELVELEYEDDEDSEVEEESEDTKVSGDNDIEGEEDSAVDIEEGIRFTPFNMKDELEEGHIDANGMYIFNSMKGQIQDNWIEDIDWVKVKETEKASARGKERMKRDGDTSVIDDIFFDEMQIYRDMVALMQPGETVSHAIKRLGGGGAKKKEEAKSTRMNRREQQLKAKRRRMEAMKNVDEVGDAAGDNKMEVEKTESMEAGKEFDAEDGKEIATEGGKEIAVEGEKEVAKKESNSSQGTSKNVELLAFIGLADRILASGKLEVYEYTYEKLNYKLANSDRPSVEKVVSAVDAGMDMFSDETPSQAPAVTKASSTDAIKSNGSSLVQNNDAEPVAGSSGSKTSSSSVTAPSVMWEYKWEDTEAAEVHGPFTSAEMLDWTNDGYFPEGVFVRKITASAAGTMPATKFNSSRRIDFEIYI